MAQRTFDRVYETSTTTGTGVYSLLGAKNNTYQSLSGAGFVSGDTGYFCATDLANGGWEIFLGTWNTGPSLARTTILASSNAGAAVSWAAGTREIFECVPAAMIALLSGTLSSMRNRAINGDMRIDQRNSGAAQTIVAAAAAAYTVDRFYATCTGANVTGQRVAGSAPDQYQYQFTGAASVTAIAFGQRFEATNVYDLTSTTATFSVKLANSLLTTVTWTAYFPTAADNWTGRTQIATGSFTVNSTLTQYSAQIALGGSITAGLEIELTVGAQTSGSWTITEFQLEPGTVIGPVFARRPIDLELLRCYRYYYQINGNASGGGVIAAGGTSSIALSAYAAFAFPTGMRVLPTAGGSPGWNVTACSVTNFISSSVNGFYVVAGLSNTDNIQWLFYLSSGLISFNAEL